MRPPDQLKAPCLVVNADDFGLSQPINDGILRAHRQGIVTAASLVANGRAFDHAVALARTAPALDLGVHLTLVGEQPVSRSPEISSLTTGAGALLPGAGFFLARYLRGKIQMPQLRHELQAQIEKILLTGVKISHLDSHQHLHVLPRIWRLVQELAREYHIPWVRRPAEKIVPVQALRRPLRAAQGKVLSSLCDRQSCGDALNHTDTFFGFLFGGRLGMEDIRSFIHRLQPGETAELMCHPGCADSGSPYRHWDYDWVGELDALTSPDIVSVIRRSGVQLAGFSSLPPREA